VVGVVTVMYLLRMIWQQFRAQQLKGTDIRVYLRALTATNDLWKCCGPCRVKLY